jgi:hypothetical protein
MELQKTWGYIEWLYGKQEHRFTKSMKQADRWIMFPMRKEVNGEELECSAFTSLVQLEHMLHLCKPVVKVSYLGDEYFKLRRMLQNHSQAVHNTEEVFRRPDAQ